MSRKTDKTFMKILQEM